MTPEMKKQIWDESLGDLGYIAGATKYAEKANELVEALEKAVAVIKGWHNADEVWDIYYNNAPEMKSIREALNPPLKSKPHRHDHIQQATQGE